MRRTKIVCTLGPASEDRDTIRALIDAGMSVARLNASHGSREKRERLIDRVREVARAAGEPVAVMVDVSGPEIRTVLAESLDLAAGDELRVHSVASDDESESGDLDDESESGDLDELIDTARATETNDAAETRQAEPRSGDERRVVGVTGPTDRVSAGDRILFDDGLIETTVRRRDEAGVVARVDSGGQLTDGAGVNVPGVELGLELLDEADRAELELAARKNVAYVAASFVGSAVDVDQVTETLEAAGGEVPVIAKIERREAVDALDEICTAADGVMVARGDLGVECPLEQVPLIQKRIVRRAAEAGVPSIIATEMLDSMAAATRPTRAEASDVANAVLDGADAVMLSGETAIGDRPVRAVQTMDRIARAVEASEEYAELLDRHVPSAETQTDALARSARYLARDVDATAVAAATESGYTARRVATYRPPVPIVAVTPDESVRRRLALVWGVSPCYRAFADGDAATVIDGAATAVVDTGIAAGGDTIVVLSGMLSGLDGPSTTNTLKVHLAADVLARGRGITRGRATGPVRVVERDGDETFHVGPDERGVILVLPAGFDARLTGTVESLAGIVTTDRRLTGHAAILARETGIPMVGGVAPDIVDDAVVTIDGKRGIVYRPTAGRES